MRIAVWCASGYGARDEYRRAAAELGRLIAEGGHELVYGGSQGGLMGTVADACLAAGGQVTGVTVNVPKIIARRHPHLSAFETAENLSARKTRMIELADAFVALPGGPGTFDEIGDVITMLRARVSEKPIALVDVGGFYAPLRTLFASMVSEGFADADDFDHVSISGNVEEALAFLGA